MGLSLKNAVAKFSDFWKRTDERDLSKQERILGPQTRKMDGGLAANGKLLRGIYTGAAQDFAFSAYLVGGMIDVPKNMTGVPKVITDKDQDDHLIEELRPLICDEYPVLVAAMLVEGTAWRWARWSDKLHRLTWEAIPDDSITSIIIDLDTGEIAELWIDEQIEYNDGEIATANVNRKRHITRTMITEEWKGKVNKTVQYKNPFSFMPIPFGHNCCRGDWRGNSVFGRVLRLLRANHDIAYKLIEILSEFTPKIVQAVTDVNSWKTNNTPKGTDPSSFTIDPFSHKMFVNQKDDRTDFLFLPGDATSQHIAALQDCERKIIKGSGIPELFFGALATGNYASTETDRQLALNYIDSIRRELTKGTQEIVNQSLTILAFMRFTQPPQVSIQWDKLSLQSETEKAQVMGAFASAIVQMMNNAATSPAGVFYFTKRMFPDFPAEDAAHLMEGCDETLVQHSSKIGQPAFDTGGMGGF